MTKRNSFRSRLTICAVACAWLAAGGVAAADTVALSGTVSDQGKPAAGVKVSIVDYRLSLATTVSNEQGRYSFSLSHDYPIDWLLVWAESSDGRVSELAGAERNKTNALVLGEGVEYSGIASDEEKRPLAGIVVTAKAGPSYTSSFGFRRTAVSGPDGAYRFVLPPRREGYAFSARGDGFAFVPDENGYRPPRQGGSLASAGSKIQQDLVLKPIGALTGRILAPDGSPAANVKIGVGYDRSTTDSALVTTTHSGPDGSFRFETMQRGGQIFVIAESPELGIVYDNIPAPQGGRAAEPVTIRMIGTAKATGRIVDAEGNPVAGAAVEASNLQIPQPHPRPMRQNPDGTFTPIRSPEYDAPIQHVYNSSLGPGDSGVSGADGRFSLGNVQIPKDGSPLHFYILPPRPNVNRTFSNPQANDRIASDPKGASKRASGWFDARSLDRPAKAGETVDLTIQLARARTVVFEGSVVDAKGNPVPYADVDVFAGHPEGDWLTLIYPLPTGGHGGFSPGEKAPILAAGGVAGPDGRYRLETVLDSPEGFLGYAGRQPDEPGYSIAAGTDRDHCVLSPTVLPTAGQAEQRVDLVLSAGAPEFISGRVVDLAGQPLAGIVMLQQSPATSITTDAGGRFQAPLPRDPRGSGPNPFGPPSHPPVSLRLADLSWSVLYPQVQLVRPGAPPRPFQLSLDRDGASGGLIVLAKLDAAAALGAGSSTAQEKRQPRIVQRTPAHLRIIAADGRPLAGYTVSTIGRQREQTATGSDGEAKFFIEDGLAAIEVHKPGEEKSSWRVSAEAGPEGIDFGTLTLGGEPSASGVLLDGELPQPNRIMVLASADKRIEAMTETDAAGKFAFEGIPPGPARLTVTSERNGFQISGGGPDATPSMPVDAGGQARDIRFEIPAASLRLHFAGRPSAQRTFRIVHLGDLLDARTGRVSDGSEQIAIRTLKPGYYVFELQGEAGRMIDRAGPVEVKPGAAPIDVTLTAKTANAYSQSMMP